MNDDRKEIDRYVGRVMEQLPPAASGRARIERDLHTHLREAAEAAGSAEQALRRMGPASDAAAGYAEGLDLTPASLADRTGAFMLDLGLGAVLAGAIYIIVNVYNLHTVELTDAGVVLAVILAATGAALALLYFPVLELRYGQTVGKRLFGLCVARENGLRAELWRTVVRRLPLFFEIFWLDAVFAPFTEKRQRAFDMVAGTIVVPGEKQGGRSLGWTVAFLLWAVPGVTVYLSTLFLG